MSGGRETLEKILGGKIEQPNARNVPGVTVVDGQQVIYFSDDGKTNYGNNLITLVAFLSLRMLFVEG